MIRAFLPVLGVALLSWLATGCYSVVEDNEDLLGQTFPITGAPPVLKLDWRVVVNNGFEIPGHPGRLYNSYNPPSVNSKGTVVFRARSTGRQQGPVSGIYFRDVFAAQPVKMIADRDTVVPYPNNTCYPIPGSDDAVGVEPCGDGQSLSTFNEFPSFPRIAITEDAVATRGNHQPVWTFDETRAGTTGVYVGLQVDDPDSLRTGASLLGEVEEFSDLFAVPGVDPITRFDVFPGAPSITDDWIIAFKGNYTVHTPITSQTVQKTGVFFREIDDAESGGDAPIRLIANSDTPVPNPGDCAANTTFGSTAPPSAAREHAVFAGFDDELDPTCGGIYQATLSDTPELATLVGLGTRVPGRGKQTFTRLGEGLSYDGRLVAFWGAWGEETKTVRLYCPTEGNRVRRLFCNNKVDQETGEIPGGGDPNSVCDDASDPLYPDVCYQEKEVPLNQGIFVYDTANSIAKPLQLMALAGRGSRFDDFLYWNYSGAPPGAGESEGDAEPPRFRSSAFIAVSTSGAATIFRVAFLARSGDVDPTTHAYVDPIDGIYLATGPARGPIFPLARTGMDGTRLDPAAVWDDDSSADTPDVPLPVSSLALERDGFRGDWLAITATMGLDEAGWGGIYLVELTGPRP